MSGKSYALAQFRLAPLQLLTMNNGQTSGLPHMDYYISSDLAEPDRGNEYYTEQLVRLPACMYAFIYTPPVLHKYYTNPWTAFKFKPAFMQALLATKRIYLVPQTLYKIHPSFDNIINEILMSDLNAIVIFPMGAQPVLLEQLQQRFARTLKSNNLRRVGFVGGQASHFLPRSMFLLLLSLADVVLDPVPFGGGLTTLEALSVGTPVVAYHNRHRSGRLALAMYRIMGMASEQCCVARTSEDYVSLALRLSGSTGDSNFTNWVRGTIRERHARLHEDQHTIERWTEFLYKSAVM